MTPKEKEFVMEYLANGYKVQQAYRKVYKREGTANYAYDILNKPDIKEFISEYRRKKLEALHIDNERIMEKLEEIAFADKGDKYYRSADQLKALDLLGKMLAQTDQKDNTIIKVVIDDNGRIK